MTTIAVREAIMAADTQLDYGGQKLQVDKIRRLPDGTLIASAGDGVACEKLEAWVDKGCRGRRPKGAAEALVLRPDGSLFLCAADLDLTPIVDAYFAIGVGAAYALGALAAGASAREAVEIAAKFDTRSGAPVTEYAAQRRTTS